MEALFFLANYLKKYLNKQPFIGVLRNRYSENMQQIYRRKTIPKYDFSDDDDDDDDDDDLFLWYG